MSETLYPKPKKERPETPRRWRVDYGLIYDNGHVQWSKQYRTRRGAKIAAWWHRYISSYGGTVVLVDQEAAQ